MWAWSGENTRCTVVLYNHANEERDFKALLSTRPPPPSPNPHNYILTVLVLLQNALRLTAPSVALNVLNICFCVMFSACVWVFLRTHAFILKWWRVSRLLSMHVCVHECVVVCRVCECEPTVIHWQCLLPLRIVSSRIRKTFDPTLKRILDKLTTLIQSSNKNLFGF